MMMTFSKNYKKQSRSLNWDMAGGTWSMKGYYPPFYDIRFIALKSKTAFIWVSQDSIESYRD